MTGYWLTCQLDVASATMVDPHQSQRSPCELVTMDPGSALDGTHT
jgi:hypothetical protein